MKRILQIAAALCLLTSCKLAAEEEIRTDFKQYFDQYDVEGTFVLYNEQANKYILYNKELAAKGFIPASTFKIYNSLIGLETGVIENEHYAIAWDSTIHSRSVINKDHNLEEAYKNSALWYYQELARRVGKNEMQRWIDKLDYGNADISENVDDFWINGNLRISARQQVALLTQLANNQLPFSQHSTNIVKKIMISKATDGYVLRTKTGWGKQSGKDVGWYVGYFETKENRYYFAICIQPKNEMTDGFLDARIKIANLIFKSLNLIND